MASRELDAVLPLTLVDLDRFDILRASLERHDARLGTCFVVVPERDAAALEPIVVREGWELVSEDSLVPELAGWRRRPQWGLLRHRVPRNGRYPRRGWFTQQLVKLAVVERVRSASYLTLDADVVCTRGFSAGDLVRDGRALARRTRDDLHPEWYAWAERVLGAPRSGWTHGVTPAVLSTDGVRSLCDRLGPRWRSTLLRAVPWTEYALYHTHLEASGRWEDLHVDGGPGCLYGASVWHTEDFTDWAPEASAGDDVFFSVVQSIAGVPADAIRARLAAGAPPGR